EDEIRAAFGADPGSIRPIDFPGEVVADEALRHGQFVAGANRTGFHLRGLEAGRDFKLGTRFSIPLGATFLYEDGHEKALVMGSYGIGVARIIAAAVEQNHDEYGIRWPRALAPYDVHLVALSGAEAQA